MFNLYLEKAEEPEIKFATIHWIIEKAREFQKNIYFCFMPKPLTVWITTNKNSSRGENTRSPDLPRNLYAGQEATVRTGHGTTHWFKIGKGIRQGCILLPWLFNFYAEYIMRIAGLEEAQAEIKIDGRNINPSDMQMTLPLWEKVKRN